MAALVSPLTKVSKAGEVYERRPEVERQLSELAGDGFALEPNALGNRNRNSDGYILDETLVFLMRRAIRNGDTTAADACFLELHRRFSLLLRKFRKWFGDKKDEFDDLCSEATVALLAALSDIDSDRADYAQVRFGDYAMTLTNDKMKPVVRRWEQKADLFSELEGEPGEDDLKVLEALLVSNDRPADVRLVAREAIRRLPDPIRTAAILHFAEGVPIESNDPEIITISKIFKKDPRTIRNWFAKARTLLSNDGGQL